MTAKASPTPQEQIVALTASIAAIMDGTKALRSDLLTAERSRKRTNKINYGLLGLLALFVALLVAIGWQGNQGIREARKNSDQTRKVSEQLADCTTPGGRCYANAQAQQVRAVGAVTQISIYVSQCGRLWPGESGPDYDAKLKACVMQRLAEAQADPTIGPPSSPMPSPAPSGTR